MGGLSGLLACAVLAGELKEPLTWSSTVAEPDATSDRAPAQIAFIGTMHRDVPSVSPSLRTSLWLLTLDLDPMYTAPMAPPPLPSVEGEEVVVGPPLPAPGRRRGTRSSTRARADDTLVEGGEIVLRRPRRSRTPAARGESSETLRPEASRSRSRSPARQSSLGDGRVEADASVTAPERGRSGWREAMGGIAPWFLRGG